MICMTLLTSTVTVRKYMVGRIVVLETWDKTLILP